MSLDIPPGIRAVLFDVYGTLLDGPRHSDRGPRMAEVARRFGLRHDFDLAAAFDEAVAASHRASDDPFPEIDVREIWSSIFPDLGDPGSLALEMEEAVHPVDRLAEGTRLLARAAGLGLHLGIVSNAQTYTRQLMARHFPECWPRFRGDLLAFSYEHRISKPDPRLFQCATAPLFDEGILPREILMIGDSLENDIVPARALGLRALHLPGPTA
ncbi:HAD family hydrolase [Haloferula sargassicola]|uniref:HAD family hydrolase n=1 Tax=Haloferula sargassicola TaxID=490096 RepID=A0ABP9UTD4_9BACT